MNDLTRRETPDRSEINVHNPTEAKCWAHELGISQDQLRRLVEKVGNSATAVRKELNLTEAKR
jgi:Protein of unknown function (DUF3606)